MMRGERDAWVWRAGVVMVLALGCGRASEVSTSATGSTSGSTSETTSETATETATETTTETTAAEEPVCCGCLCLDPAWSCSVETCLLADGTAAALAPEAGFLAVTPPAPMPESRMWYAFRPADEDPEDKPLAVFFNGGPGSSTAILFGLNTGAVTLDPEVAGDAQVVDNPHRWTRFANVLYVDPREVGYSYDVPRGDGEASAPVDFIPEHDASYFVRFILRFLDRHPQLRQRRVILVGESYGGHRAALMLQQFLFPGELATDDRFRDPALQGELLAHYAAIFPDLSPAELTPEVLAPQFGQVLVQPAITWISGGHGEVTPDEAQVVKLGCVAEHDVAQCDEPVDWSYDRAEAVVDALTDPDVLSLALGVDASTIAWMYADARATAYPRGGGPYTHDESALVAAFGALEVPERYYRAAFKRHDGGGPAYNWLYEYYGRTYLRALAYVDTLITDAGKDMVVYAPDIPLCLASYPDLVAAAVHDTAPEGEEARPGRIRLTFAPGVVAGDPSRVIRFPHYPVGGHMVSHKEGAGLAEDVWQWFIGE